MCRITKGDLHTLTSMTKHISMSCPIWSKKLFHDYSVALLTTILNGWFPQILVTLYTHIYSLLLPTDGISEQNCPGVDYQYHQHQIWVWKMPRPVISFTKFYVKKHVYEDQSIAIITAALIFSQGRLLIFLES